ncbi:glycosyltransferase [Turicibacter sanguinis]|uniref:glycosyltransferase n=1 Tax=Turicibacter sanguinis TaxID=154288 RepID=UPI0018A9E4F8|nr:glycosyltransferase [Turicibacter sanguinis]MDB8558403.1 glycosyltransferase [Turicibacter sanguinis]MDB8561199.1 glycosyltransferase [Turicibacter sanguinis]
MKPKISIIVPIYNCEKYLDVTIISILNQTLKDYEVILVNDGSTDNSLEIANKYQGLDSRIKVLSQANQGVSSARNYGLSIASGEYIGFIDGDDYVEPEMYMTLYNTAQKYNLDLVISNFEQELEGKKIVEILNIKSNYTLKKKEILNEVLPKFLEDERLNTVCTKIFKKEIIDMYKIEFPLKVPLGEDRIFNINFLSNIDTLMYINYCGYHYREVEGSATRNIREKDYFSRALDVYKETIPIIFYKYFEDDYIDEMRTKKFINSVVSYTHIYTKPTKEMSFIKRYRYMKNMINNTYVQDAIRKHAFAIYKDKGRYESLLIKFIEIGFLPGVYFLTTYSRFRCR